MQFINSDINTFSKKPSDSSKSEGEIAESDPDATEPASEGAAASPAKSDSDAERGRKRRRKPLPTIKIKPKPTIKIKPKPKPGDASSDANPSEPTDDSPPERGYLVWAPTNWRKDLKPMCRYTVEGSDGIHRTKYLSWDVSEGDKFPQEGAPGEFWWSIGYLLSEPVMVSGGDWNHATICFWEFNDESNDAEPEVIHEVSKYERIVLPKLNERAIWAEKPCVEWSGLQFKSTLLRDTFGPGTHEHRGRLRVVTHEAFGDGEIEMVMKIWPIPTYVSLGLENEMMVYRACDGKGITPEFLGYVTEQGRHISMLTAYHSEAHKPWNDEEKELCRIALHTLVIETGWSRDRRANHRDNYLIEDGKVLLIDLARVYPPDKNTENDGDWLQRLLDEDFDEYWDRTD